MGPSNKQNECGGLYEAVYLSSGKCVCTYSMSLALPMAPSWMLSTSPALTTMNVGRPCTLYFLTVRRGNMTKGVGMKGKRGKSTRKGSVSASSSHPQPGVEATIAPSGATQETPHLQSQPYPRAIKRPTRDA